MFYLIAALAAATSASPGITYLHCTAVRSDGPVAYDITLNEPASLVVWSGGGPARRQDAAQFTANAVYFQYFKIDRTSLSMIREYPNMLGDGIETETGQCRKVVPAPRAF